MREPVLRDVRRYPHLTSQDVEHLRQMPEDMAREYENLLRRQYNSEQRHREHGAHLSDAVVQMVHGDGAGGGRRRGRPAGAAREV